MVVALHYIPVCIYPCTCLMSDSVDLCVFPADIRMSKASGEEKPGADYPGDSSGTRRSDFMTRVQSCFSIYLF